jgi:hypothetical protein
MEGVTGRKEAKPMSLSLSHFRYPFDITKHPTLEPEVKRAILASWASDASAVEGQPALRRLGHGASAVAFDDVMSALKSLDK